jgi:UDP-glucose 4-epimerase
LTGEYYLAYYEKAFGIPYVALRYSNVYGPRQTSTGEAGVVAIFARQLLEQRSPTINGDGLQTRDYVYVGDVVRANVLALKTAFSGPLNIGTGSETDVVTLFAMMAELVGSKAPVVHGPAKAGEQRRSLLNCARAAEVLGWSPEVPLRRGLEQTVSYYRQATRQ